MISIDLVDYIYNANSTNQFNLNNVTLADTWTVNSSVTASITTVSGGTKYLLPVTGNLTAGALYDISLTVSGYSGSGDIGFGTASSDGTPMGITSAMRLSANGTVTEQFTALATKQLKILAEVGSAGTISASVKLASGVDFSSSIVGSLDVGDSENFPLALTFSVADIRDLNARTGTYSKTFEIPATKNNNNILKAPYYEGSIISSNNISNKKNCNIVVDNLYAVPGILQVTAIGKASQPSYYSCVFYGNNVDWSASLDRKLLKDLSVLGGANGSAWDNLNGRTGNSGIGLKVDEPGISATWCADDAVNKTCTGGATVANDSPIVYPIVSYGEFNPGGDPYNIQFLKTATAIKGGAATKIGYYGWKDDGVTFGTPVPTCDWRPGIFIYDIIHQMFRQEGYSIVSNFIETDMFKKLLMLLPNFKHGNPQTRVDDNSITGNYPVSPNAYACPMSPSGTVVNSSTPIWVYETIKFNGNGAVCANGFVTSLNSSIYDDTTGYFTMTEYGFYDINIQNFSIWVESLCAAATAPAGNKFYYIRMLCEVKTAGQNTATAWERLGEGWAKESSSTVNYYGCPSPVYADRDWNFEDILVENQWFNKGDFIKFSVQFKMGITSGTNEAVEWETYIFGGRNPLGPGPPCGTSTDANGSVSIMHKGVNVEYGQTYDLKNVIDTQSKQLEFLKGVIHAFNLQLTTNAVAKTVTIEPFNDFYKAPSQAIDWTGKVDLSQNQEDKWYDSGIKKSLVFKYKSDPKDKKVEYRGIAYWDGILDEYPYREFLSDEFELGETVFENPFFAGCYSSQDGQRSGASSGSISGTPVTAQLWGLCPSGAIPTSGSGCRPPKGYDFIPRLVHYNKMDCSAGFVCGRYYARTQAWSFWSGSWYNPYLVSGDTASPSYEYKILPTANSYNKMHAQTNGDPATHTPPYSGVPLPLTYGSVNQATWDCDTCTYYPSVGYKGLYQQYYQKMIEMTITNPRLKVVYVNLKISDIVNLDLSKLVYIDGNYYRINRVIDYQPNNNNATQVELVLWENLGGYAVNTTFGS